MSSPVYALYYVPQKLEREKLALLRRQLCKRFTNRKAVMYPIHMTLVRSLTCLEYKPFMDTLRAFCKQQKRMRLKASPRLASRQGWGGVEIERSERLDALQRELEELAGQFARVAPASFDPHISLVYAKRLPSLSNRTSPVKRLLMDRITLCMQTSPGTPFRIVKHVMLEGSMLK